MLLGTSFESCLTEHNASLMPAREARATYDALVQSESVADYVTAFRQSLRELTGTQFHPAGSALLDFIKGLNATSFRTTRPRVGISQSNKPISKPRTMSTTSKLQ